MGWSAQFAQELSQRLISYYEYAYNERKMYPFNEDELLADASEALRAEVAMYLNREIVQSVPYFEGVQCSTVWCCAIDLVLSPFLFGS
jgi:hypothetical protein